MYLKLVFTSIIFSLLVGCSSLGQIKTSEILVKDASNLSLNDLSVLGSEEVISTRLKVMHQGETLTINLYKPVRNILKGPSVVFLPGRMASDDQYDSYARVLASRGIIVAVRGWYSLFKTDLELAHDAKIMADWLIKTQGVDEKNIGVAGHSMGAKDAVLAATQYGIFKSVVAIDPDDNGNVSVVKNYVASLKVPLLLIGAEVAWKAVSICAPKKNNYQRFFEQAPAGTIELTLLGADHVQMLDNPDRFGYGICRCGTADSQQVRITARRATVSFFMQHLLSGPKLATSKSNDALIRVAQAN